MKSEEISTESEPGGTPKGRQEAKMNKRGLVPPSRAVLGAICEENDFQDGETQLFFSKLLNIIPIRIF